MPAAQQVNSDSPHLNPARPRPGRCTVTSLTSTLHAHSPADAPRQPPPRPCALFFTAQATSHAVGICSAYSRSALEQGWGGDVAAQSPQERSAANARCHPAPAACNTSSLFTSHPPRQSFSFPSCAPSASPAAHTALFQGLLLGGIQTETSIAVGCGVSHGPP